jgi:hypothetical protein
MGPAPLPLTNACGVPADARCRPERDSRERRRHGAFRLFPGDSVAADATAISFKGGTTRANNAHIRLAPDGTVGLSNDAGGAVDDDPGRLRLLSLSAVDSQASLEELRNNEA